MDTQQHHSKNFENVATAKIRIDSREKFKSFPGTGIFMYFNDPVANDADELFATVKRLGIESVFYIAKNYDSCVSFPSNHAPQSHDGLERVCYFGEKYDLSVYAVMMTFIEGYEGKFGSGYNKNILGPSSRLAAVDREGRSNAIIPVNCDRGQGYYCCPAQPEVFVRFKKILQETKDFPIKGIHLDCVRYPIPGDYCYCEYCCSEFRKHTGNHLLKATRSDIEEWRCLVISKFVQGLSDSSIIGPNKTLSALVWRGKRAFEVGQDWSKWPVDFVTPMYYSDHYIESASRTRMRIIKDEESGIPIVPGIGGDIELISHWRLFQKLHEKDKFKTQSVMIGHYDTRNCIGTMLNEALLMSVRKEIRLQGRRIKRAVAGSGRWLLNNIYGK